MFHLSKDGGPKSNVWGLYFPEIKKLFSIVGLVFLNGTRSAFHNHAFNAWSWILWGRLQEELPDGTVKTLKPSFIPVFTGRDRMHRVRSVGVSVALSFRGPWLDTWQEIREGTTVNLTHGRRLL